MLDKTFCFLVFLAFIAITPPAPVSSAAIGIKSRTTTNDAIKGFEQIRPIILSNEITTERKSHKHKKKKHKSKHKHRTTKKPKKSSHHRHIGQVPQPPYPILDDPPSGLADDQRHSGSTGVDNISLKSQRRAFIAMLDSHERHPKRSKKTNRHQYIFITYDYLTKKYSIREDTSEQ